MSIENSLSRIAEALECIAKNVSRVPVVTVETVATPSVAPVAVPEKAKPKTVEVVSPDTGMTQVITQTMPPVVMVQATPAVVETTTDCPIKDAASLMDFVMTCYKKDPKQGAKIQPLLQSIGCGAINEVKPAQYAAIYAGLVELGLV